MRADLTISNWVKLQIVHSEIAVSQQNVKEANVTLIYLCFGREEIHRKAVQSNVLRELVRMRSKRGLTTPHPEGHQLCQYIIRLIRIQEERNIRSAKQSKWSGYHADIWQSAC